MVDLRPVEASDIEPCRALLHDLPEWFGIEEANRAYIQGLESLPSVVASSSGQVLGFASIRDHGAKSAEIDVMAVARDSHRLGIGKEMVRWVVGECVREGFSWLHVKTRGPSTPDPDYEKTRKFWEGVGFSRLFESLTHWGPEDAALILVMSLQARAKGGVR